MRDIRATLHDSYVLLPYLPDILTSSLLKTSHREKKWSTPKLSVSCPSIPVVLGSWRSPKLVLSTLKNNTPNRYIVTLNNFTCTQNKIFTLILVTSYYIWLLIIIYIFLVKIPMNHSEDLHINTFFSQWIVIIHIFPCVFIIIDYFSLSLRQRFLNVSFDMYCCATAGVVNRCICCELLMWTV